MIRYGTLWHEVVKDAAAWGADEQLRLCVEFLDTRGFAISTIAALKAAMRPEPPKPPTLKEQALGAVDHLLKSGGSGPSYDIIRRALETLP
jgi:hypothetical protein